MKQKGDRKVETWTHAQGGFECEIYLRGTRFAAMLLERQFDAPDIAMLRRKLADYANAYLSLKWHPVIEANAYTDRDEGLRFICSRYYIGRTQAGELFTVEWDIPEEHRKAAMTSLGGGYREERWGSFIKLTGLPLTAPLKRNEGRYVLPYSEATWMQCEAIVKGIDTLCRDIADMFASRESVKLFITAAERGEPLRLMQ